MAATTVNGKLLGPLTGKPASAQITVTLVDYDDAPVVGFNTVDSAEILATDTIIPTSAGLWTAQLVPNQDIQLTDGTLQTAYRVVESGKGAQFTYWIIVGASADPVWAGSIRTTLVGNSGGSTPNGMAIAGPLVVGGAATLNGGLAIPAGAAVGKVWTATDVEGDGAWQTPPSAVTSVNAKTGAVVFSVQEATTTALPANTYNNGAAGVGATLTANANGALTVDGVTVSPGDRVLVQNEAAAANNGVYTVTQAGDAGHPYVLTRAVDMNTAAQIPGAFAFVEQGTGNAGALFVVAATGPFTIGTTAIVWTRFTVVDQPGQFNVLARGAVGNGKMVVDGAMTSGSNVLGCTISLPFAAGHIGEAIMIKGAGALGVTTLSTTITGYTDTGHVTLAATASTTISGATVMWASDDTVAFQNTINAATAYARAHSGCAEIVIPSPPGLFWGIAGPLSHANSGNAQLTLPVIPVTADTVTLVFRGTQSGNAIRHWLQTVPQLTGSCLVSFGVYSSIAAQAADINANGQSALLGGPTGPSGYGTATYLFSNMHVVLRGLSLVTAHSNYGLTYGAAWLWGVIQANIIDVGYGTTGVFNNGSGELGGAGVTTLSSGGSIGLGLPGTSNQNNVSLDRVNCGGGYTFGLAGPEHLTMRGCHIFYCWAGLCVVGSFHDGGGVTANTSSHGIDFGQVGIEGCSHSFYIFGSGASGIGPYCNGILDVESGLSFLDDGGNGLKNAIGEIRVRGTTGGTLSTSTNTGLIIIDERQPRGVGTPWSLTVGTPFMNPGGRWADIVISGGSNLTGIQLPTAELMWGPSAPPMSSWYGQASGPLPVITKRIPPGGWILVTGTGSAPTVGVTYE